MSDLIGTASGGVARAVLGSLANREGDQRARRRAAGDRSLEALVELRTLFRSREPEQDIAAWTACIRAVYSEIDSNRFVFPPSWSHLVRSLRSAIGEATSLAFADFSPSIAAQNASFNPTWLAFGADYVEEAVRSVQRWREEYSNARASRVRIPDFDRWLALTGRYRTGEGLWPRER